MALAPRSARIRRAGTTAPECMECQVANTVRPTLPASRARLSTSATVCAGGFSSITCMPASSARRAKS